MANFSRPELAFFDRRNLANFTRREHRIREALKAHHYQLFFPTPTNQIFVVMPNPVLPEFEKKVAYGFWEKYDETHTVIRFATSWATRTEDTEALIAILQELKH